ncbi:carcinoembryonic antigen-related cell adhesion molecule 5-like isoform X1 [Micropterus dolomieu]|uniref:carcinoembryonic antigen-related cell adhesion molecule 5-like isoform X1 n=1 Tax=Micropterus dolomieu TaxID=147949 RepID=UPI001E8EDF7A|nr:carcinoembryonic antigen-related cell adhesion molecule 5-like isoform X1 [Micropterus dolomieu]XP_045913322.1 carcinoembryonic antigen-related cell adhesion molecule 5-like isoform X1 [Micropterus dolomieu]
MTQLSNPASTCAAQWKMWLIGVFSVMYFAAVCAAQSTGYATSTVPPTSLLSTESPTIYEPPIPSLQLQSTWLDVFPSEKVEFKCSINGNSDWTFIWYKNEEKLQDSDPNVSFSPDGSVLTITAAQTYSGNYSCNGQHKSKDIRAANSSSLTLTVNANKPKPTLSQSLNYGRMFVGESVNFTCKVDKSSGWEYLFYHNGNEIQVPDVHYAIDSIDHPNNGEYHCKAKRGKGPFYTEESEKTTLLVSDPPKPSLKLQTAWPDVFKGEKVGFSCGTSSPDWNIIWYRNQKQLQEDSVLTLEEEVLNITSANPTHQGGYACKAHLETRGVSSGFSNTVDVTVYEKKPKPTLSKKPDLNTTYVGETVNFTCKVDVSSGWEYHLYKDKNLLAPSSPRHEIRFGAAEEGQYWCRATRGVISTDDSEKITQVVLEIPVPSLELITPWSDVFPAESAKLRCGINGSSDSWTYTWYKNGQEIQPDNVVSFDSNRATLSISSASANHAGKYECKGHLKDRSVISHPSPPLDLTVYDQKPSVILTQDPDYNVMFSGESVSFSCHIHVSSGWEYQWYKGDRKLIISGNSHTIKTVARSDTGSYSCQAKRGSNTVFNSDQSQVVTLDIKEDKPKPLLTQHPDADKMYTGESVSFECKVELSSGWDYIWYKNGEALSINSSHFSIDPANLSNTGTYECMATRDKTMYNTAPSDSRKLNIIDIPVPSLKLMTPWLDVFPSESVKFRCGMDGSSDSWTYSWYKDGKELQADVVSFDKDRTTLSISSALAKQHGHYSCSGKLKSRSVSSKHSSGLTLDVYDTKPTVILTQNPEHDVMHTEDSVSFSCHINISSGWEYLWYKGENQLTVSGNNHTIKSVVTSDSGSYRCQAKRGKDTVFKSDQSQGITLIIEERPQAHVILLTGWSEVFSTDSLVLKCVVQDSQEIWNYTWSKENERIDGPTSEIHRVTPTNDPAQSQYTCQGSRTGRPSYSKPSDSFKTKNLLLKRRVLLSISGCIFCGIIVVFLGCIVLRVIRKRGDDDDKPEEANLFLSMAQLKDRNDAPCPLVDYITDEAINALAKAEGGENGTVCSETTPLPITSQEDQAVATEGHDTKESDGGLVSFKQ